MVSTPLVSLTLNVPRPSIADAAHSLNIKLHLSLGDPMKRSKSRAPGAGAEGRERGATAVEFGLVAPILLLLLGGIVEFSHMYNLQISVTQAAREAARTMAVEQDETAATAAGVAGAPGLNPGSFTFNFTGVCDGTPGNAAVTVTYTANSMTGLLGTGLSLEGEGAMRCGG